MKGLKNALLISANNLSNSIFISAGEASGDLHGANLIRAIKTLMPEINLVGIGGPKMREAGLYALYEAERLAVVGLTEVLSHLKDIWLAQNRAFKFIKTHRPKLLIAIDYPDFNFRLAAFAKKNKIPVLYYISPQIWAWRKGRIKKMARIVDRLAVILPFEEEFFKKHGLKASFVGHPLLDVIPKGLNVQPQPIIGLMPGSRRSEIQHILPIMLQTAEIIHHKKPELRFRLFLAPTIDQQVIQRHICRLAPQLPLEIAHPANSYGQYFLMKECLFLLVASGTATLETAILERPFVIIYRLSPLSYYLGRLMVKIPYIGLVNWVAGRKIIEEFVQHQANPSKIASYVLEILNHPDKMTAIQKELQHIRLSLGEPPVALKVAQIVKEMMN